MRTELEQERRMAANDRFGDAAGETARRLEDMRRRRKVISLYTTISPK